MVDLKALLTSKKELAARLIAFGIFRELANLIIFLREGVKKKTYLFGTLSQTSDPTQPPRTIGTPLSEKKLSLFCFLGCLEHFIFLKK